MPHFARRTGKSFLANFDKTARTQEVKESISPAGARTGIKNNRRVSDPLLLCSSFDKLRTNGHLFMISWFDKALLSAVEGLTRNDKNKNKNNNNGQQDNKQR